MCPLCTAQETFEKTVIHLLHHRLHLRQTPTVFVLTLILLTIVLSIKEQLSNQSLNSPFCNSLSGEGEGRRKRGGKGVGRKQSGKAGWESGVKTSWEGEHLGSDGLHSPTLAELLTPSNVLVSLAD